MRALLHSPQVFEVGARAYDFLTDHGLWREQAARLLDPPPGRAPAQVLDVGCGPGMSAFALADLLPAARVLGVDLSHAMVTRARQHLRDRPRPSVEVLVADATRLPLASASCDLVTGHSFLYLVPDRRAVLRELRRVLRPGGALRLMEPNAEGSLLRAAGQALRRAPRLLARPRETLLLGASMSVWRFYSQAVGRLEAGATRALLEQAGFLEVECVPTLGRLGLHVRATV